jgi:hypothetical protein
MKLDLYVTALVEMEHMIIDVPDNASTSAIVEAVLEKIEKGEFKTDDTPELRLIEDNQKGYVYFDY